ncbi:DUF4194 domain-containing protein [Stagnimonas aquatica]|uniref:DUF4194 domain-containing protein n=1 Tax=Stagnimonas aquatica TaxID=2689987 RepID=A0A3N0V0U6_9GAMM|nr:DUF4194 domain-containing protein [Stagnimonas aquatica]ROH86417.1 DUF4194 domain-containing protein [Stagnimonas aquatica]
MPKTWDDLADASTLYAPEDFKAAAYQAVTEQILYSRNPGQRVSYELIARYRSQFREAMALLGIELRFIDEHRFVAAIPHHAKRVALPKQQTLLCLTFRQVYDDQMRSGRGQAGCAHLTVEELFTAYKAIARKDDLPNTSIALKDVLKPLQRFGLIRFGEPPPNSPQPFSIEILPGIAEVVSEMTTARLASAYSGSAPDAEETAGQPAESDA